MRRKKSVKVTQRHLLNNHLRKAHGYYRLRTLELAQERHAALHKKECDHEHGLWPDATSPP